ncbi:MAG TPA: sugar transferase [Bryobacteraceae bacterium]|nr:sugar transferase [Bryobacteraceae bacterium]
MPRILDIFLAGTLLLICAPVLAVCGVLIKIFSRGPLLFKQDREGLHGRPFTMVKLRTMQVDADAVLKRWLATHPRDAEEWIKYRRLGRDPRLIPFIGRSLRLFSFDELPQLWNVLRGDMTLVGPRPLEFDVLDRFPSKYRNRRALVRPGLTGLWQVSGRSEHELRRVLAIDMVYLRHRGLTLDLKILLRTPLAVLRARGAY